MFSFRPLNLLIKNNAPLLLDNNLYFDYIISVFEILMSCFLFRTETAINESTINMDICCPSTAPDPILNELRSLNRELSAIRLHIDKYIQKCKSSQEWQMIGTVVDRLLFGLYIISITISFITIICIWLWNNSYAE